MYKILYNLVPSYMYSLLPENNNARYTLRNSSHQGNFHAMTNIFYNSYFPSTLRLWNELSESLGNAKPLDIFKRMLLNHYPTTNVPPYYFTCPRKLHVLQTRLRMESSCLKDNLFS